VKRQALVPALGLSCALVAAIALCAGPSGWRLPWPVTDVITELRAPRVVLAALVGAALAVAGVAMQSLLQNDLADPFVLGLSGGASAGAVTSLAVAPGMPPGPAAAAGALGAAVLVRWLARGPYDPARLLLAGVAVGSIGASATGLVLVLAPSSRLLRASTYWLFGGLGTPAWSSLIAPAVFLFAAVAWMIARAERLDRLSLGPDVAASLGVEVPALQRTVLLLSVALTAVTVSAAGVVGFVGLIAPHAARRLIGQGHRGLIPVAALGGALVVMLADTVARTAFAPREVPVGLVAAAVGGPFFLLQLQRGLR